MKIIPVLILIVSTVVFGEYWSLMNYSPFSQADLDEFLSVGCEIIHVYDDGSIDFVANAHELELLLKMGIISTSRIEDLERFYERRYAGESMGGYATWDELSVWLDDLHDTYPLITSEPTSIGDTYEGRQQRVVKISSNNDFWYDDPTLPNCWYDGLIHAREPASMRNIRFFMLWLCENYGRNGFCGLQATWVLDNREIWCLPCNNVDGYVRNQTTNPGGGGMQRKNMNWSAGGDGIDLNRNWAVGWGGVGSSSDPSSSSYRGTGPLSEPESNNIDDFWQGHPPVQMHSTHTYGNILIYPWGYKDDPTTHVVQYDTQGEIMVQWATGELHGPSAEILYYSAGNTRDHSYGLYGAMSWNHETGGDFAGFWPSPTEAIKLTRVNLRSYLVTAFLAGCPYDPHVPDTPLMDSIGTVQPPFTISWSSAPTATAYALQELTGYQILLDDHGDSGPFTLSGWSVSGTQHHSGTSSYRSNGTGTMTWTETVAIPENGGGRLSFWSWNTVPNGSCQGSIEVSTDGGENWFYLQTFTRDDPVWRFNIHELDEWQGDTLSFRWETYGYESVLYIDDIRVEVWEENEFIATDIPSNSYEFTEHETGEYRYRAIAMDPDFGPGWASESMPADIQNTGIEGTVETSFIRTTLGTVSPNPVNSIAVIPVTVAPSDAGILELMIYDIAGRQVSNLSTEIQEAGSHTVHWNCGSEIPGGIYFMVLHSPGGSSIRKMMVAH